MRIWIDGKLQVYSDELSLVSTHFEEVSNLKVENEELAQNFIVETISSLKAYMIGTFSECQAEQKMFNGINLNGEMDSLSADLIRRYK